MIPEKIGRYVIEAELGRGGMATVYRAHDPRFKRGVAIKVLPAQFMHDETFRARFEREAQVIAALEHPAIVPVYDFGEENGQPYLVMRYMPGGSLAERMKSGPMGVELTARIISRLASALDQVHAKGIIHRDLKPANVLFDQYENAYLSDFGIARLTQATTTLTGEAIIGTPAYMSPEQARGDADIDGRSDIYALGAIIFQMLTGRQPYQATTPMGIAMKHITDPIPNILEANASLPADTVQIISKAMAKDRQQRYPIGGQLASDLETLQLAKPRPISEATVYSPPPLLVERPVTVPPSVAQYPSVHPPAQAPSGVAVPPPSIHPAAQAVPRPVAPSASAARPVTGISISTPVSRPLVARRKGIPVWVWIVGAVILVGGVCGIAALLGAGGQIIAAFRSPTHTPAIVVEYTPETPTEIVPAEITPTPKKEVIKREVTNFQDDFSNPSSGWSTSQAAGTLVGYENGAFRIFVDRPNWWITVTPDLFFKGDVIIEVEATKVGGPDENYFGLICRYQDENNFYMMAIVSLGYYGFVKYKDGEAIFLGKDATLHYSNAIHPGKTENTLRGECVGNTLTMYANDIILGAVEDSDFTNGDVGLTAIALDLPGTNILFDDFLAKEPVNK